MLCETERNIVEIDDTNADLRKRIWPSPLVSPRIQSVDEEMFSAEEEQESSDDPTRGLGRWFKVVKPYQGGLTRDIGGSANDMDLCTTTQVVPTPMQFVRQEMRYQGPAMILF